MTMVTDQDRDAMKRILSALDGNPIPREKRTIVENSDAPVTLAGAGYVTTRDIDAMAQVLNKLNNVTTEVISESKSNPQLAEAVTTQRTQQGVKVGSYQIMIKEDEKRIAGKQYYSIYHSQTNDVIADDLTLYETALAVVKHLNSGKYVNSPVVRKLFEADDRYTAHRTDAIRFKSRWRAADRAQDYSKSSLYEDRYQASLGNAMAAKRDIKTLIEDNRRKG